ncbi:type VI secretion system Vgr family protein [Gemmatimonas sp.]|uniref:type VI secretion system Vgr family protein n=1 Tax=Gemmatimonas sp. TaxID=1962908 RepID=UPI003565F047
MAWSQANRPYRLNTALGTDVLLLREWRGEESLSTLFRYTVTAMSTRNDISAKELLLKKVSLLLRLPDGTDRTIHGVVSRIRRGGKAPVGLVAYELEIRPPQWVLDLDEGFEIFQNKSARDIVNALMTGVSTSWKLIRTIDERPATFRYRESRWNCAARLMEQEGVWFRFDHTGGDAQLIWSDSVASAKPAWGVSKLAFIEASDDTSRLIGLGVDANPFVSKTHLRTASEFLAMKSVDGSTTSTGAFTAPSSVSAYLFDQQIAAQRDPALAPNKVPYDAKVYSKLRQELAEVTAEVYHGSSTYVGLEPGAKSDVVNLSNTSLNASLFITKVVHRGSNGDYFANDSAPHVYENEFEAIPAATPFRPARTSPWPRIGGSHTAVVVGPDGDEIYTDEWGRVQVVFKWEEEHKLDLKHSCWVRVATSSAGQQFGSVFLPRIGHEVIIEFLDGNPDNPIITGSLYNSANKHPWPLPGKRNSSGIRTKSTLKGGADDFNELRFDDTKGAELIYTQAQTDLETLVKNDERRNVQHDRTTTIKNNEEKTVTEGWEKTTISKGEQFITVADNNRTLHVEKEHTVTVNGNESVTVTKDRTITVKSNQIHKVTQNNTVTIDGKQNTTVKKNDTTTIDQGNSKLVVQMGNIDINAKMGNITVKADMGKITIEAMQAIELKVGASKVIIDNTGVTIEGLMVKIDGKVMTEVKGGAIAKVEGGGVTMIKGGITMIN